MKVLGGDADDCIRMQVDVDGAAEDGGVGAEVVAPEVVIEDDFGTPAGGFGLFGGEEQAAEDRMDTRDIEVVGGDERAVDARGFADAGEGHVVVVIREQAGEGFGVVAEVGVVGIREGRRGMLIAFAAGDGEHAAGCGGAGNGMEGGADPAEDGAVGADG